MTTIARCKRSVPCTQEEFNEIVELPMTLDGVQAVVSGWANPFATIRQTTYPLRSAEYCWETVLRIAPEGGKFKDLTI